MPRPDDREMAMVEGGQLRFFKPLDNGEDRGVDEAESEVAISIEKLADPAIVVELQLNDPQAAGVNVGEEVEKRVRMQTLARKPVHLDENWGRHHHRLVD